MSGSSSQTFIARNRAPRVQIEYDEGLYGAEKRVQLPIVLGVMSDLSGKSTVETPDIANRKFLEIDVDSFDDRMRTMAPRGAFSVPNSLTGEGNLPVDLTFETMADFAPAAIAAKVDAHGPQLEARTQLANLLAYMDGGARAETLIEKVLSNPSLLSATSQLPPAEVNHQAALEGLRAAAPDEIGESNGDEGVLDALREQTPAREPDAEPDVTGQAFAALSAGAPKDATASDETSDALNALAKLPHSEKNVDADGDLGALPGELDTDTGPDDTDASAAPAEPDESTPTQAMLAGEAGFAFGTISAHRPDPKRLERRRFRLAILGDFSGRAARGAVEAGDALAARRAIVLDPDTVKEVIEGFATDLILPIGKDGGGIRVPLSGLDDLHPDELFANVELFSELVGLRGQLAAGATADNAARQLQAWGEAHGTPVAPPRRHSAGNAIPADRRLSDFQKLIGDAQGSLAQASPIDDLLARVVGPHIRALPDPDALAMQKAVDEALSSAMRMLLHHPEFQSLESQWRSLDLIARSIETDDTLDVTLYDVSAEEIAADLTGPDELGQSGLVRLLTEGPLDEENGRGGYSALIGLYGFEETPPHAELLGRIARVAAHVDAPFIAALSPAFLDTPVKDRHPLVARAWDTLRSMPEAGHLALATPRFLLRRPYGAKSEPIYEFEFEEFTMAEGLGGMLWANPAVLVAILLARSFRRNGPAMDLGSVMSLGGMPYHYVTDRYGDQVALPCTERNFTEDKIAMAIERGLMPVLSVKGRDEVRLGSFQSLAGGEILGPWRGVPAPEPSPPSPAVPPDDAGAADNDLDGLPAGIDDDTVGGAGTDPAADHGADDDLDDLLASFGDDAGDDDGGDDGDIDAELAALLDDL